MYTIHCQRTAIDHEVGSDRVISAHRTSEGIVTYVRCPCGDVVVVGPAAGRPRRTAPADAVRSHRPAEAVAGGGHR